MALEYQTRDPATDAQIAAVESELGFRLPEQYRNWLKTTNGAHVSQGATVPGTDGNGLFLKLEPVERLPIIRPHEGLKVISKDYVVLNLGDGGSIAIKVRDGDVGSVWWADLDQAEIIGVWEEPTQEIMLRLADDWDQFLTLDFDE